MKLPWRSAEATIARYERSPEVSAIEHGGKRVLMNRRSEEFFSLDGVAGRIWELLARPLSAADLTANLTAEFDAPEAAIRRDVDQCLAELRRGGLVREA